MPDDQQGERRRLGLYLALAQAGAEMMMPFVLGLVIDYYLGTKIWFALAGILIGFFGGLAHMIIIANRLNRDSSSSSRRDSS
jgi:F0F1-type ATP synthase assembly protein I